MLAVFFADCANDGLTPDEADGGFVGFVGARNSWGQLILLDECASLPLERSVRAALLRSLAQPAGVDWPQESFEQLGEAIHEIAVVFRSELAADRQPFALGA